ncbi:DNA repair protein RecN [Paracidovorax anthurii]|uniref:DNA repair protein RecN n=1 Tax=Paracidovorax anthurii TaxID=78229 RepID=A0A328ZL23_9BURK|nr:DNA repair protein RecN [Paracidovorax anthurii]RAR83527.1 DNA replication and repair protein RecN [Paracidovorax anthurii]
MALKRIALRDFVIVDVLELDLHGGFTVLTGETGAGKSILIDALQMLLGGRADPGVVREGTACTDLCAEFDCPPSITVWLDEAGIPREDGLLLRRTIDIQGKSRAWINGVPATATQMRTLGVHLLDIHGQHAWQSLTRVDAVRSLLDAYGGIRPESLTPLWNRWRDDRKALDAAIASQANIQQERDRLQWQITELQKLAPSEGEWEELNTRHTRLSHAQALIDAAQSTLATLEDDESGAHSQLARAHATLAAKESLDPQFKAMQDVLASCIAQASDVAHSLQTYLRHTDVDPDRLQELDVRMGLWMSLSRRFKRPPQDMPDLLVSWEQELARLDDAADIEALAERTRSAEAAYMKAARDISHKRKKTAPELARAITEAMQGLGMKGGKFEVAIDASGDPGPHGLDSVAFLVAGHQGASPRPIGKVASGGELSRISLAISVTTSRLGEAPTLIFDEVDSGVGGSVAETVGKLMQRLGQDRQVLAVTHLPQVAACADHHLVVSKRSQKQGTVSTVTQASGEQRTQEMVRMLGGERASPATLAHAREMLENSHPTGKARKP